MRAKEIPNLEWCVWKSKASGADIRCPFATVDSCPRYYQSLSLLGKAGSTTIETKEDSRLLEKWKKNDLWPRTAEYETSISGSEGKPRQFSNFCPEVAAIDAVVKGVMNSFIKRSLSGKTISAVGWLLVEQTFTNCLSVVDVTMLWCGTKVGFLKILT